MADSEAKKLAWKEKCFRCPGVDVSLWEAASDVMGWGYNLSFPGRLVGNRTEIGCVNQVLVVQSSVVTDFLAAHWRN